MKEDEAVTSMRNPSITTNNYPEVEYPAGYVKPKSYIEILESEVRPDEGKDTQEN